MSITKKILQLIASFALSCTLFTPSAFSATVPWDPARLAEVQVTSGNRLFYPGPGGGFIDTKTVPAAYQKGGAMRESLIAQQKASVASGTAAKATPAATPASTSTSSTAAKTTSTPKTSTGTTVPKTAKPLEIGTITSKNGNVFERSIVTKDGVKYYKETFQNGQVNYRSTTTNKYVSGKGFNNMPPNPKPSPIKHGGFKGKMKMIGGKVKGWGGKVATAAGGALRVAGGLFSIAAGGMMIWEANAGEGARTGGDLLKAAAGGAMVGMGVASIVPGVGTLVGAAVGAVAGAATVGWQMFSETDCLTDPVTNKQTCCNTTTGDVIRDIGGYMFCQKKGGGAMAMVRQCKVGGRSKSSSGIFGWVKDLVSDDAWDDECETRWCSGFKAPPNGMADKVQYVPDTSKVCWKWECAMGLQQKGKECVPKYCDGHGPNEEEKDLQIYQFAIDEENKCIIWDCIDGYELMYDYCAEIIPEPTPENPTPAPAPIDAPQNTPDPGPDPYDAVIAKIEAQLAEMDADCGVGGKGNNDDTEILEAVKAAKSMGEAIKKLGTNKKFAERAKAAVGKDADSVANESNSSK